MQGTSFNQDREFKKMVMEELPDGLLQSAIDFIVSNFNPEDVFDEDKLKEWAEENGYSK